MTRADRRLFVRSYWPGLVLIVITYLSLTIARDLRDNFEVEIWTALGFGQQPAIFTQIDLPVAIGVLLVIAALITVKNNFKAFLYLHYLILAGCLIVLVSTVLFTGGYLAPVVWMAMTGFGLYLSYVPYNSIYFERMIATFRIAGNVGFVMYLADAMGYLGSVSVLFYRQFASAQISWLYFFSKTLLLVSASGIVCVLLSLQYFRRKYSNNMSMIKTVTI
jgi:hypothetical protein